MAILPGVYLLDRLSITSSIDKSVQLYSGFNALDDLHSGVNVDYPDDLNSGFQASTER